jgi:hypothetical protein
MNTILQATLFTKIYLLCIIFAKRGLVFGSMTDAAAGPSCHKMWL